MMLVPHWDLVAAVCFWVCTGLVCYVYAGYPAIIWMLARVFGKAPRAVESSGTSPAISMVIAAHNEEDVIASRIENLLALDYPASRLEIIIASDGSTDRTSEIVRSVSDNRIRLLDFDRNRGKAAVLNDAMAAARGDIILLSDANTMMDPSAARLMARWFQDPNVGVVCGRLILVDPASGRNVDSVYWKYETFLKLSEARLNALLGANGAIYAIRRSLVPRLSERIAVDDFVVPLLVRLQSGAALVYDAEALAYEESALEIRSEFSRRSRIGAGAFQSLTLLWPLLNPLRGWISFAFFSHKVLRWICPLFLIGAATSNIMLVAGPLYRSTLLVQLGLYIVAAGGHFSQSTGHVSRLARLATMFTAMNLALLTGLYRWALGRQGGAWQRTVRVPSSQ